MICKNCGQPLKGKQAFCGNCGMPVSADFNNNSGYSSFGNSSDYGSGAGYGGSFEPSFGAQQFSPKKKNKKLLIGIIAGVLVVAIAAFGVIAAVTGLFNPKGALSIRELEKKTIHEAVDSANTISGISSLTQGGAKINVEFGPALTQMLSSSTDISWLNNAEIDIASKKEGNSSLSQIKAFLNGTEITTLSAVTDSAANRMLFFIDGVSDSFCQTDMTNMSGLSMVSAGSILSVDKYADMLIDSLGDAESGNGSFTANGVTENCTVYTTSLKGKEVYVIAKNFLTALVDDADVKTYIVEQLYPMIGTSYSGNTDSFYADFQKAINEEINYLTEQEAKAPDITRIKIEEYVSDNNIDGIRVTVYNGDTGSDANEFFFGAAHNGESLGIELAYDGETYLKGSGTKNGSRVSGEMSIIGGGSVFVNIKLDNYDIKTGEGKAQIAPTYDAWYGMTNNSMAATLLSAGILELEKTGDATVLEAKLNGQSALKATITAGSGDVNLDMNKPTVDANSWSQTVDTSALIAKLKSAGVPESLLSSLNVGGSSGTYKGY